MAQVSEILHPAMKAQEAGTITALIEEMIKGLHKNTVLSLTLLPETHESFDK